MTFEPGQVVTLKSGSQAMTVVAVADEDIDCVWIGEEGEFFRQTIPAVALTAIDADEADTEDADEDDADSDAEDEDEVDEEDTKSARKRSAA
jgi:uncharacterized protein YodC (DUF2158 family)